MKINFFSRRAVQHWNRYGYPQKPWEAPPQRKIQLDEVTAGPVLVLQKSCFKQERFLPTNISVSLQFPQTLLASLGSYDDVDG